VRRDLTTCSIILDMTGICGEKKIKLECGPMPNVMAAQPNISGALCSTPQSLADRPLLECRAVTLPGCETR